MLIYAPEPELAAEIEVKVVSVAVEKGEVELQL